MEGRINQYDFLVEQAAIGNRRYFTNLLNLHYNGCIDSVFNPENREPLLHNLASKALNDFFEWLVYKFKPNLNILNQHGETILFRANTYILDFLIQQGVNIHVKSIYGKTAIYHSSYHKDWRATEFLLQKGGSLREAEQGFEKCVHPGPMVDFSFRELFRDYKKRSKNCEKAVWITLLFSKNGLVCKDVACLIAQFVWSTRRCEAWFSSSHR